MNELRWILLGIGVLVIAGIYFWGSAKEKYKLRSRIEKYPAYEKNRFTKVNVNPKKEKNMDISSALAAFNAYLKQVKNPSDDTGLEPVPAEELDPDDEIALPPIADQPHQIDPAKQEIMVIYITAESKREFSGPDILQAVESADLHYGDMKIFHYHGPDKKHSTRPLFSLANIHEPGNFDISNMDRVSTNGLALFMRLPAEIGGDIAFEIMLDTAHNIAYLLGGELRGTDRKILDAEGLNKLRETAGRY